MEPITVTTLLEKVETAAIALVRRHRAARESSPFHMVFMYNIMKEMHGLGAVRYMRDRSQGFKVSLWA
jgi:hypothetical protein